MDQAQQPECGRHRREIGLEKTRPLPAPFLVDGRTARVTSPLAPLQWLTFYTDQSLHIHYSLPLHDVIVYVCTTYTSIIHFLIIIHTRYVRDTHAVLLDRPASNEASIAPVPSEGKCWNAGACPYYVLRINHCVHGRALLQSVRPRCRTYLARHQKRYSELPRPDVLHPRRPFPDTHSKSRSW